ncbi:glycoside hydrolase family 13 protein [Halorhabdus salina]|uniref:glycoside hydrolase family 13 protein n=1 Tax=Halorhabdus salina TaxID=2750670 RepID=UPI0015EF70AB|nr:alpha-glucosidase [Halorhabdus salina]
MDTHVETGDDGIDRAWWNEAVVYQIYPRSFNDSDGDGVGDLSGIVENVEYLDEVGIDAVWLSPVYESPGEDNGYDISDYRAIDNQYGEMADWETLLAELHDRDMRLIMDLVINHTADEHEWFQRSRAGEEPYDDYYIWREGNPEEPPNNWESIFGGPAWSYDAQREAWYLHVFDESQPDLNWRNPDVRREITDVIRWWHKKGTDGFRIDAASHISKTDGLPDGDPDTHPTGIAHYSHGPRLDAYLDELHERTLGDGNVMTVAEMGHTTIEQATEYVAREGNGLDTVFQFDHVGIGDSPEDLFDPEASDEWDLTALKAIVTRQQTEIPWPAPFLGNHDLPRAVSLFGDDEQYHRESATLLATFLLTLRGTPFVYQGEEIGMTNVTFERLEEVEDVMTVSHVEEHDAEGVADSFEDVKGMVNYRSRDHSRTPMQWTDGTNAGFTEGDPWLKLNDNYREINVEAARADSNSVLDHYRDLIDLRHEWDVLVYGDYELLLPDHEQLYAYTRTLGEERALIVLNWSAEPATFESPVPTHDVDPVAGNYMDVPSAPDGTTFRPYEAAIYRD